MKGLLHKSKIHLKKASPTILTCVGAIGVVVTVVMAVKATPKAIALLKQAEAEKSLKLEPIEVVKTTWKCYIPATIFGLSTISCIFWANVLNRRQQAFLVSAYAMLHQSYQQYKKAAGDADPKIKAQMAKDMYVSTDEYSMCSSELDPGSERLLCYDLFSQRYFISTMASVLNAEYHINRNLCLRGYASINEFYEFLGIDGIEIGDDFGWSEEQCAEDGIYWLDFQNERTVMDDGMECCVVSAVLDPNSFCLED